MISVLLDVAVALENAPRRGADRDEPEGARYVTISDTLAKEIAALLRAEHERANQT